MNTNPPADRIYLFTRILAAAVIPVLALAVLLLYFFPDKTPQYFAWPIRPPITGMLLGSAYAGGIYFFGFVVAGRHWHRVKQGFVPAIVFVWLMGGATILHWDKFTPGNIAFFLWVGGYFSIPFLVLAAWLTNRREDPGSEQVGGPHFLARWRYFFLLQAIACLVLGASLFLVPGRIIPAWPWTLTPLTARVMAILFAALGTLAIEIAIDPYWKPAQRLLEAQFLSFVFILGALLRSQSDFRAGGWGYTALLAAAVVTLLALAAMFVDMGMQSRKPISIEGMSLQKASKCEGC
jgi:hypothetical protein